MMRQFSTLDDTPLADSSRLLDNRTCNGSLDGKFDYCIDNAGNCPGPGWMGMSLGTWEPGSGSSANKLDLKLLEAMADLSKETFASVSNGQSTEKLDDDGTLAEKLEAASLAECQWLMKLPAADWALADELASADLIALIRLFTLVEVRVPGWDAGKDSPVIPLVKILRQREDFDPALRKWIKVNTDNRYLPNGSAL